MNRQRDTVHWHEQPDVVSRQSMILGSSIIEVSEHMYRREGDTDIE